MALPLMLWVLTGLLFHVKHRYGEAYETLRVPREHAVDWASAAIPPSQIVRAELARAPLALAVHPSGRLAYFGSDDRGGVAIDAHSGARIEPASAELGRRWLEAAIANSSAPERFGRVTQVEAKRATSALTGAENPALHARTDGSKTIRVDLLTGEIEQRGALNDFIDATYAIHYLQWTPWRPVNIGLALVSIPLVLALAFSGLRMALRRS